MALPFPDGGRALGKDFADQLPRTPAVEPDQVLETFEVAPGYHLELVAHEPLVGSPVAVEWDADGHLFVCEMRGYSEDRDDAISRITRLTDEDRDGVYDSRKVFAEKLLWPTAIFPYRGGLFVVDAPDLYYFSDDDQDGVADSKELVFTGFSVSNVQGLPNSFRWGLDNRIHLACSTAGGTIRRAGPGSEPGPDDAGAAAGRPIRGHDLAFDPASYELQLTSGGGQHGMCFDDWGHKFVSSNSDHLQQVLYEDRYIARQPRLAAPPARQSIAADGPQAEVFRISPVEPWRIVRTRLRVAGLVGGPVEGGGRPAGYFTGATGVMIYGGDAWPEEDRQLAIVGDVGSNLIHRKRLSSDGVLKIGHRIDSMSEFVASRDTWFRPAQFACGPDGCMTVVDVYREVIEHPKSLPPEIKQHVDLTSGRDRGRLYRIAPDGYRHRPTPPLSTLASVDLVRFLDHPNRWHRETASRLIYQRQDPTVLEPLRRQARVAATAQGRIHSLYALAGMKSLETDTVVECLQDGHPQVVRHAIRLAEQFPEDPSVLKWLRAQLRHPSIEVRYQLAFTVGEMAIEDPAEWLALLLLQDPADRWIQTAVGSSSFGHLPDLFEALAKSDSVAPLAPFLGKLAGAIAASGNPSSIDRARNAIVDAGDDPSLLPVLARLLKATRDHQADPAVSAETKQASAKLDRLVTLAIKQVEDTERTVDQRISAIDWLAQATPPRAAPALLQVIAEPESSQLQRAAISAIGRFDSDRTTPTLLQVWPRLSPQLRRAAGEVLFGNTTHTLETLEAIESGLISRDEISIARWNALAQSGNQRIRDAATSYLRSTDQVSRDELIDRYGSALRTPGDPGRGETVFKQQCAGCHQVGQQGHALGPSLVAAATRGPESILVNVLDPNREVNPQFINYAVLTIDGNVHAGMIASENANSIVIKRAENVTETILRSDIEEIRDTGQSIMPVGLEKAIPPQAMSDLIAYLLDAHS
ncbi:c-type cytochrome [Roseiconus nitratireducens]|uniref:C-type cytochrome n=1 Tax=Roseiconus nitratireducens TaxID=2605748 RepID=A0A5M6DEC5_9BACT|nr:PVC-type heme-binding CxxCH protein [Roseiconus nitratireducens]KAA5544519.1 c-type cytochrome [Roseiconus nitratireducens]